MSINNRQRRRAKKQKRQRDERLRRESHRPDSHRPESYPPDSHRPPSDVHDGPRMHRGRGDPPDDQQMRAAVLAAAEAFRFEPDAAYRSRLEALQALERGAGPSIERALAWWVERGLDRAWGSGWQPADVLRSLRRTLSPAHADALAPAVAESGGRRPEAASDDRWADQVAAIRVGLGSSAEGSVGPDLDVSVEAVSLLLHLPSLPRLGSTSGGRARTVRGTGAQAMLERVRALLAKAESTTFPEEAEALSAKAQELMARHAIDQAVLDAGQNGGSAGVVGWRIGVDDPYAAAKSILLDRIAKANRCSAVWCKHVGFSTVFGARSDLEMVELLFTSILVQGTEAMLRSGRSVDRSGRSRTRSFRQSFLLAYADRIGERLAAATAQVVAEGAERHGAALLPVLAGRAEAVEEAVQAAFPTVVEKGTAISNYSGWAAGRAAAEVASLAVGEAVTAG
ncbi:MAG TPA: DUF2786 domain-containing protein [Acidimicrobiales bacterium]|nr:DUF2786 domain-containing protein [Acidimicrobiales bacterium]